jgi:lipopolysaccharide transport protein LptA
MDLDREVTVLSDGVVVHGSGDAGRPAFDLTSERVVFDGGTHRIEAEGDVRLRSQDGALDARRLTVQLDPGDRRVVGLRALWEVRGWLRRPADGSVDSEPAGGAAGAIGALERLSFAGTTLALDLDETERPVRLQLEGSATAQATLESAETGGTSHLVRAVEIVGSFVEGRLSSLLARRPVELEERARGELVRVGRSRRALAAFDEQGRMVRVDLEEKVALVGDDSTANADRASLLLLDDDVTLWGQPAQLQRAGDEISAPEILRRGRSGVLEAKGGVRATLTPRDGELLGAAALGDAEGPIHVEAQEASFREAEDEVTFRGGVRAWRGTSLLLADQLRGNRAGERLAASGSVRTVWRAAAGGETLPPGGEAGSGGAPPPPRGAERESVERPTRGDEGATVSGQPPGGSGTQAGDRSSAEARRRQPVEISASHLTFESTERRLRYEQDVTVTQGAQVVTCRTLVVDLDPEHRPNQYDCSGEARVVDRDLQRKVEGTRVVYRPDSGEVEVTGEPVRLEDPKLRIEGPMLWYSVETEKVTMGPAPGRQDPRPNAGSNG